MIEVTAKVVGLPEIKTVLEQLSGIVHRRLVRCISALGTELQRDIKEELNGPVLDRVTGRLGRSITQVTTDEGDTVRSRTGTNVSYGAYHELGFHGTETVRAHVRTMMRGSKGRSAMVREHERKVNYAGRPFLRPALDAKRDEIRDRISRALRGWTHGG
jgi:phage gpG-like protein